MIRRIAVHRVWNVRERSCRDMQVVEVDAATHCVERVYPLVEEIRNTEWWGGLMIISPVLPLLPEAEEDFQAYTRRMNVPEGEDEAREYAFYVVGFRLADSCFGAASRMTRV